MNKIKVDQKIYQLPETVWKCFRFHVFDSLHLRKCVKNQKRIRILCFNLNVFSEITAFTFPFFFSLFLIYFSLNSRSYGMSSLPFCGHN